MDINRITNGGLTPDPIRSKKAKDETEKVRAQEDRVEFSEEAVSLFKAQGNKRLEEIRNKIDSGYYLQRSVSEKVVDAMFPDLKMT
jgi:anti-sigma28 factor (negative regulator of flagellin synthesis)